jgi:hypothetical protein
LQSSQTFHLDDYCLATFEEPTGFTSPSFQVNYPSLVIIQYRFVYSVMYVVEKLYNTLPGTLEIYSVSDLMYPNYHLATIVAPSDVRIHYYYTM